MLRPARLFRCSLRSRAARRSSARRRSPAIRAAPARRLHLRVDRLRARRGPPPHRPRRARGVGINFRRNALDEGPPRRGRARRQRRLHPGRARDLRDHRRRAGDVSAPRFLHGYGDEFPIASSVVPLERPLRRGDAALPRRRRRQSPRSRCSGSSAKLPPSARPPSPRSTPRPRRTSAASSPRTWALRPTAKTIDVAWTLPTGGGKVEVLHLTPNGDAWKRARSGTRSSRRRFAALGRLPALPHRKESAHAPPRLREVRRRGDRRNERVRRRNHRGARPPALRLPQHAAHPALRRARRRLAEQRGELRAHEPHGRKADRGRRLHAARRRRAFHGSRS